MGDPGCGTPILDAETTHPYPPEMTGSPGRPRPVRAALRRHMMARAGLVVPDLAPQSITVNGVRRTFVAVPGPGPGAPLLLVLHGAGGTGLGTGR